MKLANKKINSTQYIIIIVLILSGLIPLEATAQTHQAPIPVEMFFGDNSLNFEMVVSKKFSPTSKFGFFSVATYTADYNNKNEYSINIPVHLNYTFGKGFGVMGGTEIGNHSGFAPIVGPQHKYISKKFLAITIASYSLNKDKNMELFGLYEYKPELNENWQFYSRLQFIYKYGFTADIHKKSFLHLRAGLKRNSFVFGLGANLDQSGPNKDFTDNYGVFLRYELR